MKPSPVAVNEDGGRWSSVGKAFRHQRGGGWNIQLDHEPSDQTLVLMDANGYAPGTTFRLMVTRPGLEGGTDGFEVGRAWVSQGGRAVLANVDVILPADERKLVILPSKQGGE